MNPQCCIPCTQAAERRAAARRYRVIGWLVQLVGVVAIGLSFPVKGLPGAALTVGGVVLVWVGWYLMVRRGRVTR